MSGVGQDDLLAIWKEACQFFRNWRQKWVRLCAGEQQHWSGYLLNRPRLDIGEEHPRRHHHIPFVRIAQRFIASRLRHLVPRVGIVEDIGHEYTDPSITIASAKCLLHRSDHPPLNILKHCFAGLSSISRQMLQQTDGRWLSQDKSANKFFVVDC